jgi:hypothetical protein
VQDKGQLNPGDQIQLGGVLTARAGPPSASQTIEEGAPRKGPCALCALLERERESAPRTFNFDNDPIFQGTHRWPDSLGRVIRLCLSLDVVPVFVPSAEMGFQAMIESYNGWWQTRVWTRFHHPDLDALQQRSGKLPRPVVMKHFPCCRRHGG